MGESGGKEGEAGRCSRARREEEKRDEKVDEEQGCKGKVWEKERKRRWMGSETEPEVGLSRSSSLKPLAAHPFLPACSSLFLFLLGSSSLPSSFNSNRTPSLRAPTDDYDDGRRLGCPSVGNAKTNTDVENCSTRGCAFSSIRVRTPMYIRLYMCVCVYVCAVYPVGIPGSL